jgi:hypothetical protein
MDWQVVSVHPTLGDHPTLVTPDECVARARLGAVAAKWTSQVAPPPVRPVLRVELRCAGALIAWVPVGPRRWRVPRL